MYFNLFEYRTAQLCLEERLHEAQATMPVSTE
jgi:hypothetical protein